MDQRVDHDIVTQGAPAPGTVRRAGLSGRVLMLTAVFVTLAQFVIFAPSIANFRDNWLRNRLSAAFTAALVLEGRSATSRRQACRSNCSTASGRGSSC